MKAKHLVFLFLAVSTSILLNPFSGAGQNSKLNLIGTEWSSGGEVVITANTDGSITTLTRVLAFNSQGKVDATRILSKTAGSRFELVVEYVTESYYNGASGRYEYQTVPRQVQKQVLTLPEVNSEKWKGTYEVEGKTVRLDFPNCTIEAKIQDGSLVGVLTYKGSKEKEAWILSPATSVQNNAKSVSPDIAPDTDESTQRVRDFWAAGKRRRQRWTALVGDWEGTYSCGQGLTNLSLSISRTQPTSFDVNATFKFSANSSNPSVPSGSFRMTGTYLPEANKITLKAADWISQPSGYSTVDLVGSLSEGRNKLSGNVIFTGCTTFDLVKK